MEFKWEIIEDGYHRRDRLVSYPSGRIVGGVEGLTYSSVAPWFAYVLDGTQRINLGQFVTHDLAKNAVMDAAKEPTK